MQTIYLASPFGFSEGGREFYYGRLVPTVLASNVRILDPWQLTDRSKIEAVQQMPFGHERREAWKLVNFEIGENNRLAIDSCDGLFAVLDGADVDGGTAAEIGYGCAKEKPIIGYRSDFRMSGDNEGAIVNPQIEYFIKRSGGIIISTLSEVQPALRHVLSSVQSAT